MTASRDSGVKAFLQAFLGDLDERAAREGREGELKVLTKQLTLKFGELPEPLRARLASASLPELDTWTERVLFATSLAQVFDEPSD
jgi:hypothetical protein